MCRGEVSAEVLIERAKKYPYAHFQISDEQLAAILREQPEFVTVSEGTILVLEFSGSGEKNLHWAADSSHNLIHAIHKLRADLHTKAHGKWRMPFVHPELAEPLRRIGFKVASHYMDYWLYGVADLALSASKQEYIRKVAPTDFDRLAEISVECCYAPGWLEEPKEWFADWSSDDNGEILVAEIEGNLAGYCCVKLYGFDSEKGTVVWIQALAVAPAHQGYGFGKSLLLTGLRWGQRGGAQRSFIATDKRNHVARKLYQSVGFRPSGEEEINLILSVG